MNERETCEYLNLSQRGKIIGWKKPDFTEPRDVAVNTPALLRILEYRQF